MTARFQIKISIMHAVLAASVILSAASAHAVTRYVSPSGSHSGGFTSWATAATNIQPAVDAALVGDTVLVTNGTYRSSSTLSIAKGINVTSVNGRVSTIIDGRRAALCVSITHPSALVAGFTITNGSGGSSGGGVFMSGGILRDATVVDCQASAGGGISLFNAGLVDNCLVISNVTSGSGGGVFLDGGGMVTNSTILGNYASTHGGGAYIMSAGIIVDSQLARNTAGNDGGAVNFNNGGELVKCRIYRNNGNKGGAVNVFKGTMRNCLLYENHGVEGGAGYLKSGAIIESCTIVSNSAVGGVGGLLFSGGGTVENTILYYNDGTNYLSSGGGMTYQYSCTTPNPGGTAIVTNEPQFLNLAAYDVHLALSSPCRDTGTNRPWMTTATDMDNLPRIWPSVVDMGIYELVAPAFLDVTTSPTWVSYDVTTFAVAGTNNQYVVGGMRVTNPLNNASALFAASPSWTAPTLTIGVGVNTITVIGTNAYGVVVTDSVPITRGGPGTGLPLVHITNTPLLIVSNLVTSSYLAGTNNVNVVGDMYWHNHTTDAEGPLSRNMPGTAWSGTITGLAIGANDLHVHGTNMFGTSMSDNITIIRLDAGTNPPFIDITNPPDITITYDFTSVTIGGTNYNVVDTIGWSNQSFFTGGNMPASSPWIVTISNLIVGVNEVYVFGTNAYGAYASDQIDIRRGGVGTGTPFVDVTNVPFTVTYDDTFIVVAGTNNIHVMGGMWATNLTAGGPAYPFPAASSWLSAQVPLAVGANTIRVYGTNVFGIAVFDTIAITRGPAGTGIPFVDVTNAPVTLTYDATTVVVAGTNNANVVGGMAVSNATLGGAAISFPASASWTTPAVPLGIGPNTIVVAGTNAFGVPASDLVVVTRGPAGTGVPFTWITNAPVAFTYDTTSFVVRGTNNANVVGGMWVSNAANGAVAAFGAAAAWSAPGLPLDVGANDVTVYGTNAFGVVASDTKTVTRGPAGTGTPFLNVTSTPAFVTYDVEAYAIAGTNNANVVGMQMVSNELNGGFVLFPAAASWTTPMITLSAGANTLRVYGTNAFGAAVTDTVVITRGGPGTGTPFVRITNDTPHVVSNLATSVYFAGTNNINVVGAMYWSNHTHGTAGPVDRDASSNGWSGTVTGLEVGANDIHVHGTNVYGQDAFDDVTVVRLDAGTNPPYIDITNGPDIYVTFDFDTATFGGTNYNVVGTMRWSNVTTGAGGAMAATDSWTLVLGGLAVGVNEVYIYGTNLYGAFASDLIDIKRGVPGTGIPFLDVTTTPYWVSFDVVSQPVSGTNNQNVVGGMWADNVTTVELAAAASWTTPDMLLDVGTNIIAVHGTNAYGVQVDDSVTIVRGPAGTGTPFLDVTTTPAWVTYDVTGYTVAGTNNLNVVGTMRAQNLANGATVVMPAMLGWTAPELPLNVGSNSIVVYGTNAFGVEVSDAVSIERGAAGTGTPFLDVTTTPFFVTYDGVAVAVAGTNNDNVIGDMWVENESIVGPVVVFAASTSWTTPTVPLALGPNSIRVSGTNAFGVLVSDNVVVTRGPAGTGIPFVDLTNDSVSIAFETPFFAVSGTNNVNVVGMMWVSNSVNGDIASFPAAQSWIAAPVSLIVGANLIYVYGTNAYGAVSWDSVLVTHLGPCSILPSIWVTSQPTFVTYDVTGYAVAGTNNPHVVGTMRAVNTANGAFELLAAAPSWTSPTLPLSVGSNSFYVFGTNILGVGNASSVVITRGPAGTGVPFLDVTSTPATVYLAVTTIAIAGTNNPNVVGGLQWSNTLNGAQGSTPVSSLEFQVSAIPLAIGTNTIVVVGTNAYGATTSDAIDIVRLDYDLVVAITEPNGGADYTAYNGAQATNVAGTVNETPLTIQWTNSLTGAGGTLANAAAFSFSAMLAVGTNTVTVTALGIGGYASADITIVVDAGNAPSGTRVLCTWPQLVGATQTGSVEFVTTQATSYSIVVLTPSNTVIIATGTCSNGWNLLPFHGGALPFQAGQSNALAIQVGVEQPILAAYVRIVPDLATGKKQTTPDFDGDLISVAYKSKTGTLTVRGRSLFIANGSPKDTLAIKVKKPKTPTDKACRISGIFSDSGFASLAVVGSVDRIETAGVIKGIKTKGGGLGHLCSTRTAHVRFDSIGKSKISLAGGSLLANTLIGTLNPDGSVATRAGLSQLAVSGGDIGSSFARHWLQATFVGNVQAKGKKGVGGILTDYALYLTGEVKAGKDLSIGNLALFLMDDTSGANANVVIVCGHNPAIDPTTVTSWVGQPVAHSMSKLMVKGGLAKGTVVLDKKPKKTIISGITNITWIVNGVQQ